MIAKKLYAAALLVLCCSCSLPVLHRDVMEQGVRNPDLTALAADPERFRGQLFIFGGIIASTTFTKQGSLIEALYVPVDSAGYLQNTTTAGQRFLALRPRTEGLLDPVIYHHGRRITLAAQFMEARHGKLGEMEYTFPFFAIQEIYLWPHEPRVYYAPPYYSQPWYPAYGPWFGPGPWYGPGGW